LNQTNIPIGEWIEKLNKLIYCYLDIQSYSKVFDVLIESTIKTQYTSILTLKIQTLFENPQIFLSHLEGAYNIEKDKITFSEETQNVYSNLYRSRADFYENSLKLIKICKNILNYLQNKHKFDEFLNNKEEFISLNKKVY
jgi:hypothetical protein